MKFTNGYWLLKEGVTAYPCVEVRDVQISPTAVTLYVAPVNVVHRGQTLDGSLLTLTVTSPQEGILSVAMEHFWYEDDAGPDFDIKDEKRVLEAEETEYEIIITSGKLTAYIRKETFQIDYYWGGFDDRRQSHYLTGSKPKQMAYMNTPDGPFWRERLQTSVNEQYYGFGERFTPFVKNGQTVDIWNEDGGTASEQAYKNIPFCISNRGYGVFVNHPELVSFEVCSEVVSKLQFSVAGEALRYMIIGGDELADVLERYTALTGRPALPPAWSYGLWLSTSFTTDYSENTVNNFIDGMFKRDIPLSVFHFDCFWMKEYEWCNFTWDEGMFPDPDGMLKRLKEKGLKICCWINPYIGKKSPLFAEAAREGYLIKKLDAGRPGAGKKPWQWNKWQPGMGIVDFTNPSAVLWYQNHLKRLMAQGVDSFKTDFGERIPVDVSYYDGSDPQKMHNYYPQIYNKIVFDILPKGDAVLFARSATAGGQQFPVHWGGDCEATYESMAESLRGGLSLSVCGFGFWSHDIGGFENTATPDLYKRWVAFGLFSTHSRLHGSVSYRVPWLFDEESVDVLRFFTKQKHRLMPYIFAESVKAHKIGLPVMRPMVVDFRHDPVCSHLDTQYMFGGSLLAAPVFNEEGQTQVYLPVTEGKWTNWFTDEQKCGGQYIQQKHDYFSLGLWVRPNSVVVTGHTDESTVYDYADGAVLHVFEPQNIKAVIYDTAGSISLEAEIKRNGDKIYVNVKQSQKAFEIVFHNLTLAEGSNKVFMPAGNCSNTYLLKQV